MNPIPSRAGRRGAAAACACALAVTGSGVAAEQADGALEVVEVVGQKMERDLQQTFDSVSVISGDELDRAGVEDLRDALRLVPNINYSPSNNGNNGFSIRGINSEGLGAPGGNQSPVSTLLIDGAPQSLEGVRKGARGVWDLESIEVLRGPQTSLGRNALAGALVVRTRDPSAEFESSGRVVADTLGHERAVMVSGPLFSRQLSYRLTAEQLDKRKDIDYGDPSTAFLAEEDFYTFRGKLLFEPDALPGFSAKLTVSRAHDDPAITAVSGPDFFQRRLDAAFDGIEVRVNDVDNRVLELNYVTAGGIELTAVTAWTETRANFSAPSPRFERDEQRTDNDISQDLRLAWTSSDARLSVLAGMFYGRFDNTRDSRISRLVPRVVTRTRPGRIDLSSCINLDLAAADSGRWVEFFSDSFATIGQGFNGNPAIDGFFQQSALPALVQIGAGADVFPNEGDWRNVGAVVPDLDALTGSGTETVALNAGTFAFERYIADDDDVLNLGYTTQVLATNGTATYQDGVLNGIAGDVDLQFVYDASGAGLGLLAYPGTLSLGADNTFSLQAGNPAGVIGGIPPDYLWDFSGTYSIAPGTSCPAPGRTLVVDEVVIENELVFATVQNLASNTLRRNYAAYIEFDWRFYGPLRLLGALRYDTERFRYEETNRLLGFRAGADTRYSALLPKYGLVYDIGPMHSVALTATRGYRGGFIDRGRANSPRLRDVDPEFLWSYELALRTEWLERRLRANANFFYYDWKDQQVSVVDPQFPFLTITRNAGSSEAYGAEFALSALVTSDLELTGSLGLLKTRLVDFATDVGDFSGNEFPEAPRVSASLAANWFVGRGFFLGGDVNYQSSMFATSDLANLSSRQVPGRTVVYLRAGYEHPSGQFRLAAEVNNALDEAFLSGRDINGGAFIADPRVASISAQVWF